MSAAFRVTPRAMDAPAAATEIRAARLTDLVELEAFINQFTGDGTLLPRTRKELARHLRDFRLAFATPAGAAAPILVGCAALQLVNHDLAEVRSVALDPAWRGRGLGRRLVEALFEEARQLHLPRVFCLTRQVDFFARLGFAEVPKEKFPDKVWSDCRLCPRRHACDETAMERELVQEPAGLAAGLLRPGPGPATGAVSR